MTPSPASISGSSGSACSTGSQGTPSPAERVEALLSKIYSIAYKFPLNDQSDEDVAHYMIERLLTRCAEVPDFIFQDDGYWLRFAKWMGYRLLHKTIVYNRFTIDNDLIDDGMSDPYELYEQAVDLSPEINPESALELDELRQIIDSLSHQNQKLAALLMIGYSKS